MHRGPSSLLVRAFALSFVGLLGAASLGAGSGGIGIAATTFTLDIVADPAAAEPGEGVLFTLWLNVTGGGQLQFSRVNVSLDPDLFLWTGGTTHPGDCTVVRANVTFAEWQCTFLRSGRSYVWSLPANVSAAAVPDRSQSIVARAEEIGGGQPNVRSDLASVWIVDRLIDTVIYRALCDSTASCEALVGSVVPGDLIQFTVNATNRVARSNDTNETRNSTAFNVTLDIDLDPTLDLGSAATLDYAIPELGPESSLNVSIYVIVLETAPAANLAGINATLGYHDVSGRFIGPARFRSTVEAVPPNPLPAAPYTVVAVIAFALLAVLAAVLVVPIVGQRSVVIDEVFLMHRTGILIQHLARAPGHGKDDDLVASMFVAIQDFVRDSFQTKATLDEISFGGRKAAVLRGRHLVLAALISRGHPRFLFPQLRAAERAVEKAHGDALEDWDGRVAGLAGVAPILKALLDGGHRGILGGRGG